MAVENYDATIVVYINRSSGVSELMLEWQDSDGSWEHRVFWGADSVNRGTLGTPSRIRKGDLFPPDQWVRLEIRAQEIGLVGGVRGFKMTLVGGQATWDYLATITKFGLFTTEQNDTVARSSQGEAFFSTPTSDYVWVDEDADIPVGARQGESNYGAGGSTESWEVLNGTAVPHPTPVPVSGQHAFRTQNSLGTNPQVAHQIYFSNATTTMAVNQGDVLFAYVYLDPANPRRN
jgi:hypothetical protein